MIFYLYLCIVKKKSFVTLYINANSDKGQTVDEGYLESEKCD